MAAGVGGGGGGGEDNPESFSGFMIRGRGGGDRIEVMAVSSERRGRDKAQERKVQSSARKFPPGDINSKLFFIYIQNLFFSPVENTSLKKSNL